MGLILGAYTLGFVGAAACVLLLTWLTYQLLSGYLHSWKQLKPIPGIGVPYPLLGNALQFKSNAGDFFCQLVGYTKEFQNTPLLKVWIGPIPFLILYHAETIEVFAFTAL
ncbi:hypothetical protein MHYP_G00252120 [Metynnis hypsauchen]